ncbi:MAG: hypothetical protein K2I94_09405, partial [Muribaculaceae bacterium]|nr:hypothetical protein [Muribaculaceae bacterium]
MAETIKRASFELLYMLIGIKKLTFTDDGKVTMFLPEGALVTSTGTVISLESRGSTGIRTLTVDAFAIIPSGG